MDYLDDCKGDKVVHCYNNTFIAYPWLLSVNAQTEVATNEADVDSDDYGMYFYFLVYHTLLCTVCSYTLY